MGTFGNSRVTGPRCGSISDGTAVPEATATIVKTRNPDASVDDIIPTKDALPAAIGRFVDVGFTKFVLIPTVEPDDWDTELDEVAALVKPLEN